MLNFSRYFSLGGSFVETNIYEYGKAPVVPSEDDSSEEQEEDEEEPVTPTAEADSHATLSALGAGITLFKALVGPGLLFLPAGFKNAGLLSAVLTSGLVGAIATYTMALLLDTHHILVARGLPILTIGDVAMHTSGRLGRIAVLLHG